MLKLLHPGEKLDSALIVALQALCLKEQREGRVVCRRTQETGADLDEADHHGALRRLLGISPNLSSNFSIVPFVLAFHIYHTFLLAHSTNPYM